MGTSGASERLITDKTKSENYLHSSCRDGSSSDIVQAKQQREWNDEVDERRFCLCIGLV
jgi:hypothetical protein